MKYNNIISTITGGINIITINRPKQLNALNKETISELSKEISISNSNPSIRCIILTGSGDKAFVAGADIKEFVSFTKSEGKKLAREGQKLLFDKLSNLETPTIAAINGFALGGGLELAMSCHLRIAVQHAKLGLPEVSLGVIPGYGGTQRLPALIGKGNAMEMILTGDIISADKALELGLINQVVAAEKLLEATIILAKRLMKNSPNSIKNAIKAINASDSSLKGFKEENLQFSLCFGTTDFKEGVAAFLEKRKPEF